MEGRNQKDPKAKEDSTRVCVAKGNCEDWEWWKALAGPYILSSLHLMGAVT